MAYNQQLSVLGQVAPATTGTAGQVLVSAGSSASSYWASAIPVSAYSAQFNGSTQFLTVAASSALEFGSNNFTIELWWYPTSTARQPLYHGSFGTDWSIGIDYSSVSTNQKIGIWASSNGSSWNLINSDSGGNGIGTVTVIQNSWNHIVFVRNGTTWSSYVNGQLSLNITGLSGSIVSRSSSTRAIGMWYVTGSAVGAISGFISNFRAVNGVAVYTGAFTPPTSPLGTAQGAGTNISAVSSSQVGLLTCNGPGFTDSSSNALTITNNGNAVTSQFAPFSSFSAIARSATQTQTILTSGSGTYYTPSGVAWLRIRMVGGGGGGGGGSNGTTGSSGANTTFGSSFLNAGGGVGGVGSNGNGGAGGTSSIGSGATGIAFTGGAGDKGDYGPYSGGGNGGSTSFGGSGLGGRQAAAIWSGTAGATNSGAGGGGGNVNNGSSDGGAGGGGAGGYIEAYISSPAASYAYTIGTGGGGGTAGTNAGAGAGGGSGIIIIEENYAVNSTYAGTIYPANYLIVAGGGGGSSEGGGGAGGLLSGSIILIAGSVYSAVVGSGGAGGTLSTNGVNGTYSSLTSVTTTLGGGGGGRDLNNGVAGGSGGGSGNGNLSGGAGTTGQGNAGGGGYNSGAYYVAGGGGGAGAVGGTGTALAAGNGGVGLTSTLITTAQATTYSVGQVSSGSVYFAGGGSSGSGSGTLGSPGLGGGGVAGNGGNGGAGSVNSGGGGGGATYNYTGGLGGSGIVIVSVPTSNYTGITTGSPTVVTNGNQTVIIFKSSGSYTA